jgi:ParB family chromosome partitioning protein
MADRHAGWAQDMPRDVAELWGFIAGLDHASVMALFAHCASQTVNAVKLPWERKPRAHETADSLAKAVALDMTAHWTPTARTYLGRVTKAHILAAVCEALGDEAADRIASLKKQPMAEAAEQLLNATGWLPTLLRTEQPEWPHEPMADAKPEARKAAESEADEPAEPEATTSDAADLNAEDGDMAANGTAFHQAAE